MKGLKEDVITINLLHIFVSKAVSLELNNRLFIVRKYSEL